MLTGHTNVLIKALVSLIIILSSRHMMSTSYEMTLDTENEMKVWTFNGTYFYARHVDDIEALIPSFATAELRLSAATGGSKESNQGIWFTRHIPGKDNKMTLSYSLRAALFAQAWIKFLAAPSVGVVLKAGDSTIATFYSDGKSWCDGITTINLKNTVTVEVATPQRDDYILIDKIILGIMTNISALYPGRKLNPCLQTPLPVSRVDNRNEIIPSDSPDEGPPDMFEPEENKRSRSSSTASESELDSGGRPNLSTLTSTTTSVPHGKESLNSTSRMQVLVETRSRKVTTNSSMNDDNASVRLNPEAPAIFQQTSNNYTTLTADSQVKCNCVCSCAKPN